MDSFLSKRGCAPLEKDCRKAIEAERFVTGFTQPHFFGKKKTGAGFTFIELLVAIAILAGIAAFVFITFVSLQNNQALDKQVKIVTAVLDEARSLTLAAQDNSQYGVHLATTSATLFKGVTYSQGATDNQQHQFHSLVIISEINLGGGGSNVVFNKLTGSTASPGTFIMTTKRGDESETITITGTGVVSAQ